MVIFVRLAEVADAREPARRPLNASPPELLDFCTGFAFVIEDEPAAPIDRAACNGPVAPGVPERDAGDEPAGEASMENASFFGARDGGATEVSEPSLRGCSAGLLAPVEFQRSANESDMAEREEASYGRGMNLSVVKGIRGATDRCRSGVAAPQGVPRGKAEGGWEQTRPGRDAGVAVAARAIVFRTTLRSHVPIGVLQARNHHLRDPRQ